MVIAVSIVRAAIDRMKIAVLIMEGAISIMERAL